MSAALPKIPLRNSAEPVSRPVSLSPGQTYRQLGVSLWGKGAYEREPADGGLSKYQQLFRAEQGDIVVNKIWARNGSVAVVDDGLAGCHGSNEFPMFAPIKGRLDPRWMHWVTKTKDFWAQCDQKSQGTSGQNRIKPEQFLDIEIPLPSFDEQRRIVARIEELTSKVDEARHARASADSELAALYAKLLFSAFHGLDNFNTTFGAEFVVTTGGTPSRANPGYWGGQNAWVSSGEVAFRDITDTREKITDLGLNESNAKTYPAGTVLLAMIGQGKTRGQCAILRCAAATNQNVAAIHVTKTNHSPRYVYWWLYANYQKSRSTETGTAQPALSADRVKQMQIPLPDRDQQDKIVAQLDVLQAKVDAVKALQTETAAELDALLPAILDKAFKGEL